MNDNELDELLNSWTAPPAAASLRERVRTDFRARFRRQWFPAFGPRLRAIAALGVFLLVLGKAAPLVLWAPSAAANARYVVETERSYYAADGSSTIDMYSASYDAEGHEIPLSRSLPNNPLGTMGVRTMELLANFHRALAVAIHGEFAEEHPVDLAALRRAGCAVEPVVARETILSYPTVAIRHTFADQHTWTVWMAPDLGCFELRSAMEVRQPDGTLRTMRRNEAVKVTVNKPQS